MAIPHSTTGSLEPAFATARLVGLAVNLAIYPYARRMVANHAEPSFALLRYSLGGYRPSKTDRLTMSLARIHGSRLDLPTPKGGISLATPLFPKEQIQSLPLMLSMKIEKPMTAYS
jgi:hypothetical protein